MRRLEISAILWYNDDNKKSTSVGAYGSVEVGSMICDLRSDHNLDHLRLRTTWELWTLWHEKAQVLDKKSRKSTQNEAKNRCRAVWDVDAAGSNPVTPTKFGFGKQFPKPFSLLPPTQILRADESFSSALFVYQTTILPLYDPIPPMS